MTPKRMHTNRRQTDGFSTAEMAVVLVLIGILLALVIPRFAAPTASSQDRKAQASAHLAYEAARIVSRSAGGFVVNSQALSTQAPEIKFKGASDPSTSSTEASLAVGGLGSEEPESPRSAALGVAVLSESGTCWLMLAIPEGEGRGVVYGRDDTVGGLDCTGKRALEAGGEDGPLAPATTPTDDAPGSSFQNPRDL